MRCQDNSVTPIRVGLDKIGIVGLHDALKETEDLDASSRDAVVDRMLELLGPSNYIPDSQAEAYRTAFWREALRHRGRDFSALYSEVPATVRGEPGGERGDFVALVVAALAAHELRPVFTFVEEGRHPELVIGDEVVARAPQNRASLDRAIRRTFSHW